MPVHPQPPLTKRRRQSAFTLVELMATVGIVAVTSASAMVLSARSFNLLRSSNDSTLAAQCLQERVEQIRSSGWTTVTSPEIPETDDDDTLEDASDSEGDLSTEVLLEPTEFPDDLGDTDDSDPGLATLMATALTSATDLKDVEETVTVTKYPEGSTAIKVRRNSDKTVSVVSHNKDLVYDEMVRVVLQLSWKSKADGRTKTVAAQSIITKNSQ